MTVIGDAMLDVSVRPTEPMRRGGDVPADVRVGPGGQGANVAVRLARRGVEVELVCALGSDAAGDLLRRELAAAGVRLREVGAEVTGAVVVLGEDDGERSMLSRRMPFAAQAIARLPTAGWLVLSGYLFLEPAADRLAVAAATGGDGVRRMLVGCAVPDRHLDAWRAAARTVRPDLLVLNREELDRLGPTARDVAVAVTEPGGAAVTIGELRCAAVAPPGPPVIDTTGAGDAFAAMLVAGLREGGWPPRPGPLQRAVDTATAAAAAVARAVGAQAGVPGERQA